MRKETQSPSMSVKIPQSILAIDYLTEKKSKGKARVALLSELLILCLQGPLLFTLNKTLNQAVARRNHSCINRELLVPTKTRFFS